MKVSGEMRNGKLNGLACVIYKDGTKFEGNVKDCNRHGYGKLQSDGVTYEGMFHDNLFHGKGVLTNSSMTYEGDFINGKTSGRGKYVTVEGDTYEGEVYND